MAFALNQTVRFVNDPDLFTEDDIERGVRPGWSAVVREVLPKDTYRVWAPVRDEELTVPASYLTPDLVTANQPNLQDMMDQLLSMQGALDDLVMESLLNG